jgi:hypothetical protein
VQLSETQHHNAEKPPPSALHKVFRIAAWLIWSVLCALHSVVVAYLLPFALGASAGRLIPLVALELLLVAGGLIASLVLMRNQRYVWAVCLVASLFPVAFLANLAVGGG